MKSFSLRPAELLAVAAIGAIGVAVLLGSFYGIALSVLLLASCALGLVITLLWLSVRNLTGDTPLSLDEALGLGAPSPEEEQKRAVLRALKDLEYERSVGKISEADYRDYSARYREEARRLMERVDASLAQARELAEKLLDERVAAAGLANAKSEIADDSQALPEPSKSVSTARDEDDAEPDEPHDDDSDDDEPDSEEGDNEDDDESDSEDRKPVSNETNGKAVTAHACPACAGSNDADAKFCKHCGAALDGQDRAARAKRAPEEKTS